MLNSVSVCNIKTSVHFTLCACHVKMTSALFTCADGRLYNIPKITFRASEVLTKQLQAFVTKCECEIPGVNLTGTLILSSKPNKKIVGQIQQALLLCEDS